MPATDSAQAAADPRSVLLAQAFALARLSLRRIPWTKTFWTVVTGAAMPVILVAFIAFMIFLHGNPENQSAGHFAEVVDALFAGGFVHFGLFFSALTFGSQALREELDEQTLHLLFLQPAPRWLFLAAKFVAFLVFAVPCFVVALLLIQLLLVPSFGLDHLLSRSHFLRLAAQIFVIGLELAVFGALFLAISSVFKNLFYGIFIYGWELAASFMPDTIKSFSITYYLKAVLPFSASEKPGVITVLSEGPGAVQTCVVLTLTFVCCAVFACWWSSRKECLYTT